MMNHQSNLESSRTIKSNEQRLKSLDEYEREKQSKKRLIKESLNNQIKTTHVKFDSDNDDEDNQPKPFIERKIQLFDNHDEIDINEHFNKQKNLNKRKKLQDLQARLTTTNDPRFQMSERFIDDQQKIVDDDDDDDEHFNNDISMEEEKKKSLAILDQITNAKTFISKPKTRMIRFDPSKTEHKIYELNSGNLTNEDNINTSQELTIKSVSNQTKNLAPIIDSTRTYEFDKSKLKSLFNKSSNISQSANENRRFQFQFFNHQEPTILSSSKTSDFPKATPNGKTKIFLNKPDDTSSEEDNDNEKESLVEEKEFNDEHENKTFFFFDIDDRLKDGLESFVRTEDLDELERSWPTKRKEIAEALRTKHRKAIQRKDKFRVKNHRRRQQQNSTYNHNSKANFD